MIEEWMKSSSFSNWVLPISHPNYKPLGKVDLLMMPVGNMISFTRIYLFPKL